MLISRADTYWDNMVKLWDMLIRCAVIRTGIKWLNYGITGYVDISCRRVPAHTHTNYGICWSVVPWHVAYWHNMFKLWDMLIRRTVTRTGIKRLNYGLCWSVVTRPWINAGGITNLIYLYCSADHNIQRYTLHNDLRNIYQSLYICLFVEGLWPSQTYRVTSGLLTISNLAQFEYNTKHANYIKHTNIIQKLVP